ncbi:hypothetical protein JXA32_15235 [Candidatus Sumerlaeota bacterium]|nr:hypothetical protein [Candidatus Sumerlaeota bacterium]
MESLPVALKNITDQLSQKKYIAALLALHELSDRHDVNRKQLTKDAAQAVMDAYHNLHFPAVHKFYRLLPEKVPLIGKDVQTLLEPNIQQTMGWAKMLQSISIERRANTLMACVRNKQYEKANSMIQLMMPREQNIEQREKQARYLGVILGTLINDQDKVDHMLKMLDQSAARMGFDENTLRIIQETIEDRRKTAYMEGTEQLLRPFKIALTDMTLAIRAQLPGKRISANQVTEETVERFRNVVRMLIGTAMASNDPSRWADLLVVLLEFCPQQISIAGARAGVEERLYMAITPLERRIVAKAMYDVGQISGVADAFINVAKRIDINDVRIQEQMIQVMGMLRSEVFVYYIEERMRLIPQLLDTGLLALGDIGSSYAVNDIIHIAQENLRKGLRRGKLTEGQHRRAVHNAITALGKIAQARKTTPEERQKIFTAIIEALPEEDLRLQVFSVQQLMHGSVKNWDRAQVDRAIRILAHGLWIGTERAHIDAANDAAQNSQDPRLAVVDTLARLAQSNPDLLRQTIEEHLSQPGIPFLVCAKIFQKYQDDTFADLIVRMISQTMTTGLRDKYRQEMVIDPSDNKEKPITEDMIVSELIFALTEMRTEESIEAQETLYQAFREGRLEQPGRESMKILLDARTARSREESIHTVATPPPDDILEELEEQAGEAAREAESAPLEEEAPAQVDVLDIEAAEAEADLESEAPQRSKTPSGKSKPAPQSKAAAKRKKPSVPKLSAKETAELIKQLKPGLFMNAAKRQKIIAAIVRLGECFAVSAVEPLIDLAAHKDPLLRGAALTALSRFADISTPTEVTRNLGMTLIERIERGNSKQIEHAKNVLDGLHPEREPFRSMIMRMITSDPESGLARHLFEVQERGKRRAITEEASQSGDDATQSGERSGIDMTPYEKRLKVEQIHIKRRYLEARRAWIKGGKQGPPPEPPPGMH